jgi:YD repeat-containing protein
MKTIPHENQINHKNDSGKHWQFDYITKGRIAEARIRKTELCIGLAADAPGIKLGE